MSSSGFGGTGAVELAGVGGPWVSVSDPFSLGLSLFGMAIGC